MSHDEYSRSKRVCVLVPDANPCDASVYIEETGEFLDGVESVDYHLNADPDKSRVTITIHCNRLTFYSGAEASGVKNKMDELYSGLKADRVNNAKN